jgi:8-oxo-dGTP diphosphatase
MKLQVGVKALVRDEQGRYLFLQRSKVLPTGEAEAWDIPGGRLAADEDVTLEQALRREILEETGLRMADQPQLLAAQDILHKQIDLHVVRLTYTVQASGELVLSEEHQKSAWLTLQEARKLKTDPYLKELLGQLAS